MALNIKTKLSLTVSALLAVLLAATAFFVVERFRDALVAEIFRTQYAMLRTAAESLDTRLETAHLLLTAAARSLPRQALADPDRAQALLDGRADLHEVFDNKVFIFSREGRIFVESPFAPERRGKDFSFREYIRNTLAGNRPYISDPYTSSQPHKHPVIMMTAPILDDEGRLLAILAASLDLMGDNFLGKLSERRIGKGGYFYLTTGQRIMVMHPDRSRIFKPFPQGGNQAYDAAIAGFQGTMETVNTYGLHMYASFTRLTGKDWVLAVNYPVEEALAPVRAFQSRMLLLVLLGMLASVLLVHALMGRLLSPMLTLTRHMDDLAGKRGEERLLPVVSKDETGHLTRSFNEMVATLDRQKAELEAELETRRQAEERIEHLAYHDALTSLPNRALLMERARLALALAQRRRESAAVLFLDLDRFKEVNDSLGHAAGDAMLIEAGHRLESLVREADTVSRLGGDEFVLLLTGTDQHGAGEVAEKILAALRQPYQVESHSLSLSTSVGIALFPQDGGDMGELLKNADAALYRAKQEGRNTLVFYNREMNVATFEKLVLETELKHAIDAGQLVVYYQPKIALADNRLVGAEALVRWRHPQHGLITPGRFIPVAETTDLIHALCRRVLADVAAQLAEWRRQGLATVKVAVNLSPRNFRDPGLPVMLRELMSSHGLGPTDLELELTESTLLEAASQVLTNLMAIEDLGLGLAIDDFGTGYSSLGYLRRLPISVLKIDQSFVRDLVSQAEDRTLAGSIIALGHSLGLGVVAEGVESAAQRDILMELGCPVAQGYFYSPPLPAGEFRAWLEAGGNPG